MFSFLRKPTRSTATRQPLRKSRLAKAWLNVSALESREVPATFVVSNLSDGTVTGPNQLPGSLRQAIFDANALPGADIVDATAVSGTLTMIAGEFQIAGSVTINGPGAGVLTIDATSNSRHFNVSDDAVTQIDVAMNNMKLVNGAAQTPPQPNPTFLYGGGGSIYVRNERLSLDSMIITGSKSADFYSGGAIYMGDRPIPDQFNGNNGVGSSLTLLNSVLENNTASGLSGSGGAVYFQFPNTGGVGNKFTMVNSTLANNIAGKRGGGVYFSGGNDVGSVFAMRNATVSGNKSLFEFAGGVQINSTTGFPISILNSTITNNTAMTTPGGGGLALNTGTGTVNIENSIIADNFGTPNAPELFSNSGVQINARNNIIGSKTGLNSATFFNDLGGNIFGSAKLGPLTINGGTTPTHLPAYNSPAINPAGVALTTLNGAASIGSSTAKVNSASSLVVGSFVLIDSEIVQIDSINSTTVTFTAPLTAGHATGAGVNFASMVQTTLGPAITAGDATAIVVNTTGIAPGTSLLIDSEIVKVAQVGTAAATTLNAPMTTINTQLNVVSASKLVVGMNLTVDNELVRITAIANIATTLSAAIPDATAFTCTVTSATGIVAGMLLLIDTEYVLVTGVSGSTISIARGQNGSTAAAHANGAAVTSTTVTVARAQLGTTAAAHSTGATLFAPSLTLLRGQSSTVAAAHGVGRALMIAFDQIGNARRQGLTIDIGAVEVNTATPAAIATVSNVTTSGGAKGNFTITFTDDTAINVASIKNNNNAIRVIGPGGFDVPATYLSLSDDINNGTPRTATYEFAAPTGTWDYLDNGTYSIVLQPNQVFDTGATAIPSAAVGRFQAAIGRNLVVTTSTDGGAGSLRDAIDLANQNQFVTDMITFDTVTMGGSTVFVSFSGMLITDPLVINGPGITIEAGGLVRPFSSFGPGNMAISFSGMTIANGKAVFNPGVDSGLGAAVLGDDDQWTLTDCVLTGNDGGGAIALYSVITWGSLSLVNCKIENNIGGGVLSGTSPFGPGHDVSIQNSSISNNTKGSGFSGRTFSFNVANTTIANNSGALRGGGINIIGNFNSKGNSIINSTISGNSVTNSGAGIYMYWSTTNTAGQRVLIGNTSIVGNTSTGGFQNEPGGGINNRATTDYLVDFENCVIASNTNSTVPDLNSRSKMLANNTFVGILQPASAAIVGVNNKLGSKLAPLDPFLAPLANNGGPTLTRAPFAGSPLVDFSLAVPVLSTLTAAMTNSQSTATVASTAGFVVGMYVQVDSEIMRITGITAPNTLNLGNFSNPQRGLLGTTAAAHNIGAVLTIAYTQPANDQRGAGFPRAANGKVDIGAVEVDPNIPAAVLTTAIPLINTTGQTPVVFQVTYSDNIAIDVATLKMNTNAIKVTDPMGGTLPVTYVTMDNDTVNGTPRTVTYSVSAPGGSWDALTENGIYTISVEPLQVADTSGNFVQPHAIGTFQVGLTINPIVTNANDSGPGSLREALEQTNKNAGVAETITFDSGFFSTPRIITLTLGDLPITDRVSIVGPGAKFATVQGFSSRIFSIDTPDIQQPISISGLTMTGGNGTSTTTFASGLAGGGAIMNLDEALTINDCVIAKNEAVTGSSLNYGGGILLNNSLATLVMTNTIVTGNSALSGGGGISIRYGNVNVTISNCVISNNRVTNVGGGSGGGIDATYSTGTIAQGLGGSTITLENSTIANNSAFSGGGLSWGGGISTVPAKLTINNTTFTGNVAFGGNGGGIALVSGTYLTLRSTTISGNAARNNGGGLSVPATFSNGSSLLYGPNYAIINTVIAGNKAKFTPDISGATSAPLLLPVINSFIGVVDPAQKLNNISSTFGTLAAPANAQLGPAVYNGGLTGMLTMLPLPGSPLINSGANVVPTVPLTTLSGAATAGSSTIAVAANGPFIGGVSIVIDAGLPTEETVKWKSHSSTTITLQSPLLFSHAANAILSRPTQPANPANDQRGPGFPRQFGTIDIGGVEVNPAIPVASGSFGKITAPTVGSQSITITFTDDVGMDMATIVGNNAAVRITGPGGFNTLANYVSATPGTGAKVETVVYSFAIPGGGWDNTEDGIYTVSIEPNAIGDGTNFVSATTIGALQVAIPRTFVVDLTVDDDDSITTTGNLSIREAIRLANENVGVTDIITFNPTVFATPQIIQLFSGTLTITDPVSITGPGKALATIDALGIGRVMSIDLGSSTWGDTVTMSGLTFANGNATPSIAGTAAGITSQTAYLQLDDVEITGMVTSSSGGAIGLSSFWTGLKITNSKLFNNSANTGAGIYVGNNGSSLTTVPNTVQVIIQNTVFDQNNSKTSITSNSGSGAGLYVLGGANVSITDSEFTNNVVGTSGAAIFNNGSVMTIARTKISNNSAISIAFNSSGLPTPNGQGGGIFLGSTAGTNTTITNSTIDGNFAGSPTLQDFVTTGAGGGIFVSGGAVLTLESSTLSGNSANTFSTTAGGGGGIYLTGTAQVTVSNSTISGNSAYRLGGGISIGSLTNSATPSLAGSLIVRNSTIAYNNAVANGGGINFRTSSSGTPSVTLTSSIVSNNTSIGNADLNSGTGNATTGFAVNNSFIGVLTGATITGANNKNTATDGPVNLNPTLALNGAPAGSPLTHAFAGASAAIDNGSNATPLSFDQRGTSFSRTVNNKSDMGAFEVQNATPLPTVTTIAVNDGSSVQRSMVTSMTITFSAPVTFPNGIGSAFSLIRTTAIGGGATGSVNVTGTGSGTNVITLTFVNGGAVTLDPAGSLPDGMYSLTLISNQIAGVGGFLDGNMNGVYQGTAIDNVNSAPFHRLFGDADGSGTVTAADFNAFRLVYGGSSFIFDYDGNGSVTASDFNQFRTRYGVSI